MSEMNNIAYNMQYFTAYGCHKQYVIKKQESSASANVPLLKLNYLNSIILESFKVSVFIMIARTDAQKQLDFRGVYSEKIGFSWVGGLSSEGRLRSSSSWLCFRDLSEKDKMRE